MSAKTLKNCTLIALCLLGLAACSSAPVAPEAEESKHWSFSQTIESRHSMITLFDPADLAHHEAEPADWYRYDFAFANDLETGRFAAVLTDRPGSFDVRLTSGPLLEHERLVAGPRAVMRLRVINGQLLLSGGDAWPSLIKSAQASAYDPHWVGINNGDYQVIITALDRQQGAGHDFVFQLLSVDDIALIPYAPGIPYLVMGEPAGVAGINAGGLNYREDCSNIPDSAAWSPLTSNKLPLPGTQATIGLGQDFHSRGLALKDSNKNSAIPIVVARKPVADSIGLFIKPDNWQADAIANNGEVLVNTRVLCAVRVVGIVPGLDAFELQIEALPGATDQLDEVVLRELTNRFESWSRLTSDPAWRFKSAQIKRTQRDRSVILGILDYLNLSAKFSETMLSDSNETGARRLLDHMSAVTSSASR